MLVEGFNVAAADGVMCRNTVNVGWDGRVFDCDFNQQLDMGMRYVANQSNHLTCCCHIFELLSFDAGCHALHLHHHAKRVNTRYTVKLVQHFLTLCISSF